MPTHWTYEDFSQTDDLFQGDIVEREGILPVLSKVHSHFCNDKYLGFIIISQTCDLVLRGGNCKTNYISLAVIRGMGSVLPKILDDLYRPILKELYPSNRDIAPGLYPEEHKLNSMDLLKKIINQNEQSLGMVYLHQDGDVGISEPSVALLRVSIALRSSEHYKAIQKARTGRLAVSFRNKLGWLAGNLFSRVDTSDWSEQPQGKRQESEIIGNLLLSSASKAIWAPAALIQNASKVIDLADEERETLASTLAKYAPKPFIDIALEELDAVGVALLDDFSEKQLEVLTATLASSKLLSDTIIHCLFTEVINNCLELNADAKCHIIISLFTDKLFHEMVNNQLVTTFRAFMNQRQKRSLAGYLLQLENRILLEDNAASRVCEIVSSYDCMVTDILAIKSKLLSVKYSSIIIECVRSLCTIAICSDLPNRITARLKNRQAFRSAIRP